MAMGSQTVIPVASAKMIAMAMSLAREMVTREMVTRTATNLPP